MNLHSQRDEILFQGPGAEAAFERARALLFAFGFYAPKVVAELPKGGLAPGVLLQQHARVGPLRFAGPVRVFDVWDRASSSGREAGFSYEALPGHVERGVAQFALALKADVVSFRIESDSAPAKWFAKLGAPVARVVQRRAVAHAFRNMRAATRPRESAGA
ncbi:MAG: DUF1990 family protein [Thermoplasmatota archaeon]